MKHSDKWLIMPLTQESFDFLIITNYLVAHCNLAENQIDRLKELDESMHKFGHAHFIDFRKRCEIISRKASY